MCIVIDTNRLPEFLKNPEHEDMQPLHRWLARVGRIVYSMGDKFSTELSENAKQKLEEFSRSGQAIAIADEEVVYEARKLREGDLSIKSKDHHVLALARLSNTRLLFTRDKKLHQDIKNREIIPFQGSIYQDKSHRHLLTRTICSVD